MVLLAVDFIEKRNRFYEQFPSFWDRINNTEYALYDCYKMTETEIREIRKATKDVYHIFKKSLVLVRNTSEETLLDLGFPKKTFPFLKKRTIPYDTVIGRFDFAKTAEGIKLLEFNADTPTFIRELFEINGKAAMEFHLTNPNQHAQEQLATALRESIGYAVLDKERHPYVVFTGHEEDIEDRETVKYLMKLANILESAFVPIDQIQIISEGKNRGVYDHEGKRIDLLYRHTYPIEYLIEDITDDGYPIGLEFLKLVDEQEVAMLNPISAFLLQNKALMALIWGLHELNHPFFSPAEHRIIDHYFLPTYLDEDYFTNEMYVAKPIFGREGDTIKIKQNGKILHSEKQQNYKQYFQVYQKYVDLPKTVIRTEKGEQTAHLLIGSFIVNEKPSAIGIRAGEQITNNLSYFLPCGIKKEGG